MKDNNKGFNLLSSTIANVWHPQEKQEAYEWWYFDAISDSERDALVVIFMDNFIFSPRYNQPLRKKQNLSANTRFPAVAFFFYKDGKVLYRAINEFSEDEFQASVEKPFCRIGPSEFHFDCTPYGSGYLVKVNAQLAKNKRLEANLEWLSVESDLLPKKTDFIASAHNWNLVAARSDVTGKIKVFNRNGKLENTINFRGTGYHDHNADSRWMPEAIQDWYWGRVHFSDSTVVFYHYKEFNTEKPITKLVVIRNSSVKILDAETKKKKFRMNRYGLSYWQELNFSNEELELSVNQYKVLDGSFFYLRFLSEARVRFSDGLSHVEKAISEHLSAKKLKRGWFDRLIDMRIGKNGKGAFLP
jgi:carotenoid 1,2-hydratase